MEKLKLLEILRTYFDDSELRDVCFLLDVDYDLLPGRSKGEKARELITYLERRQKITELIAICKQLRPDLSFGILENEDSSNQTKSQLPLFTSDKQSLENITSLVNVAEEILAQANNYLIENEETLLPFLQNPAERQAVYTNMFKLYHTQKNRGDFGRWRAFLENALETEIEQQIKVLINDLLSNVNQLYETFYSNSPYGAWTHPSKNMTFQALSIANALRNYFSDPRATDKEAIIVAQWYLDSLRSSIEDLGRIVGNLRSIH